MTGGPPQGRWWRTSVRTRLAVVLAAALAPVLLLSVAQSLLSFQREEDDARAELADAAQRSAASVNARIGAVAMVLRSLKDGAVGSGCAHRLAQAGARIPGYVNVARFDSSGSVTCAADTTRGDPARWSLSWFHAAATRGSGGVGVTGGPLTTQPVLLVDAPAADAQGGESGVLTAMVTAESLGPGRDGAFAPTGSEVSLVDTSGRYLTTSKASAFPSHLLPRGDGGRVHGADVWIGRARDGSRRLFARVPLSSRDLVVLLSAPYRGLVAWAAANVFAAVLLPLAAFCLALAGVWIVADRGVVRWIAYLQRLAVIYARGRYNVHPDRARWAPPEIRELARSLDAMAVTIAARDRALRESLVQKDGLLREIHHRVKNNLQVISSLLNMQQRALADPVARAAMSDTRQRITALALIYRALYEGPDLRRVNLRDFLEDLIAQLVMTDNGMRSSIRTDLAIDALTIDPDHLAPLALFAVEAITNAKKHGLADGGGLLSVSFRVHGASAELAITDSGRRGVSEPVVGEGVGRTLMTAFARQLGGEVRFCPEAQGGMTARLTFPTPSMAQPSAEAAV